MFYCYAEIVTNVHNKLIDLRLCFIVFVPNISHWYAKYCKSDDVTSLF